MKRRPRSTAGVVAVWPAALDAVYADPTAGNLDALCTLLDAIDTDICRHWDDRTSRLTVLAECRAATRQANAAVSAAALGRAKARGSAAAAARQAS